MLIQSVCQISFKKIISHVHAVYICTTASVKESTLFMFQLREHPGNVEGQHSGPSFESGEDAKWLQWENL